MPLYQYKCVKCGESAERRHAIGADQRQTCAACEAPMKRVPATFTVNWNGRPPSGGGVTNYVQHLINDAPRRRDELAAKKEQES